MTIILTYVALDGEDETVHTCIVAGDGKVLFNRNFPINVPTVARELMRFGRQAPIAVLRRHAMQCLQQQTAGRCRARQSGKPRTPDVAASGG